MSSHSDSKDAATCGKSTGSSSSSNNNHHLQQHPEDLPPQSPLQHLRKRTLRKYRNPPKTTILEDYYRVVVLDHPQDGPMSPVTLSQLPPAKLPSSEQESSSDIVRPSSTASSTIDPALPPIATTPNNRRLPKVVLPGVIRYDDDWSRDLHDFFNLIVLVPVVVLNALNWNWDLLLTQFIKQNKNAHIDLSRAWTGDQFTLFFQFTACYFLVDLLWILINPTCVRSPATILQHHLAALLYILIPYKVERLQWCMGACMAVEVNTWFLIARRVFNKAGFPPWRIHLSFVSLRVKVISIFFYTTWIAIRCVLYPYLMPIFYRAWIDHSKQVHTPWNIVLLCVPLHACFCLLNLKWTYDLIVSKIRYWRRGLNGHLSPRAGQDKGL